MFTEPLTTTKVLEKVKKKFLWHKWTLVKHHWVVVTAFEYSCTIDNVEYVISVPAGFKTDFASVPKGLWNIFPPDGVYSQAAVVHDFIYVTHCTDRKAADKIFLSGMRTLGAKKWRRNLMYAAVRTFGGSPWKKGYRKTDSWRDYA